MSLVTYEEARPWARAIKEEVMTRRMPKWHAVRGYGDFSNDPSLSPFEIALIAAWADGGAPRGTDANRERRADCGRGRRRPVACRRTRDDHAALRRAAAPAGTLLAVNRHSSRSAPPGSRCSCRTAGARSSRWITDYDPSSPTTYRLRVPLVLPAGQPHLAAEARGACALTLTVAAPR